MQIAQKAYELNSYNNKAFTIVVQSKNAMKYLQYINMSKEYFYQIEELSNNLTPKNKIRIKMMLEIIIQSYKFLPKTILIPDSLKLKAKNLYTKAKKVYDEVFETRDK